MAFKHLILLSHIITAAIARGGGRIMVSIPPRHGKSFFISQWLPVWFLSLWPDRKVILTTYEANFAAIWGRRARNIIKENGHRVGLQLSEDSTASNNWELTTGGGMITAGVGGPITGKGGHLILCFPGDTIIETEIGGIKISELLSLENTPLVLTYDHLCDKLVYRKITGWKKVDASEFIELETVGGRKIRSTPEHRIYDSKLGYREARDFLPGDGICTSGQVAQTQNMSCLREAECHQAHDASRLLLPCQKDNYYPEMHTVRQRIRETAIRIRKALKGRAGRFLLFNRVQPAASFIQAQQDMPRLWKVFQKASHVLFERMSKQNRNTQNPAGQIVWQLRKTVSALFKQIHVLFYGLQECRTFKTHARSWKLALQKWGKLFEDIQGLAPIYSSAGPQHLLRLRQEKLSKIRWPWKAENRSCDTSYRLQPKEQPTGEPDYVMFDVPLGTSSLQYDTISRTRRICKNSEPVYDIEIEGTHNFFANGVLVHNCDDPHKNWQEAQSSTIRETIKDWFDSTLYTRLEPGGTIIVLHCMTGDTPVAMADGSWKRLDEIMSGDMVRSYKDGCHVSSRVVKVKNQGPDNIIRIKTGHSTVKCNARHPFLVQSSDGTRSWVRAGELSEGDLLVVSRRDCFKKRMLITELEAWLLGYMFGDGWITVRNTTQKGRGQYVSKNGEKQIYSENIYPRRGYVTCCALSAKDDENEKVASAFECLFGHRPKKTKYGYIRTEVAKIGRWFIEHGLDGKAKTKRLPLWLFSQPECIRSAFLKGFNEADGSEISKGRSKGRWTFGSTNENLIKDIRHLARSVGYNQSNISVYKYKSKAPNSPKTINAQIVSFGMNPWSRTNDEFITDRICKITHLPDMDNVYDIQVENTECFIADGIVSHNTRWHEDDLIGYLMREKLEDGWVHLRIPAIAEDWNNEEDPLGRKVGEALCPERYDITALNRIKANMTPMMWNALFQQRPAPMEGSIFLRKNWKYYKIPPTCNFILQSWDTSSKKNLDSAYTVCTTWGVSDVGAIMLDRWRERVEFPQLRRAVTIQYMKWKPNVILIEDRDSGQALIQQLQQETSYPVLPIYPDLDKVIRAQAVSPMQESGRVWLPDPSCQFDGREWVGEFIDVCATFPNTLYKDDIDSMSQALAYIMTMSMSGSILSCERRRTSKLLENFRSMM